MRRRFFTFVGLLLVAISAGAPTAAHLGKGSAAFRQAQIALQKLGYDPGRVDGRWTRISADALKRFQIEQKLPQSSGRLDRATITRLTAAANAAITSPSPVGHKPDSVSLEVVKSNSVPSLFNPRLDPPTVDMARSLAATEVVVAPQAAPPEEPRAPPGDRPEVAGSAVAEIVEIKAPGNLAWLVLPIGIIPILLGGGMALRRRKRQVVAEYVSSAIDRSPLREVGIDSKTSIKGDSPAGPSEQLPTAASASSTDPTSEYNPTLPGELSPGAVLRARIALRAEERAKAAAAASAPAVKPTQDRQPTSSDGLFPGTALQARLHSTEEERVKAAADALSMPEAPCTTASSAVAFGESLTASAAFPTLLDTRTVSAAGDLPADMSAFLRVPAPSSVGARAAAIDLPADISVLARSSSNRIEQQTGQARAEDLPADIFILASLKVLSENSYPSSIQPKQLPTAASASSADPTPDHHPTSSGELSPGAALRARIALRAEERARAAAASVSSAEPTAIFPTLPDNRTVSAAADLPADMSVLLRMPAPPSVGAQAAAIDLPADISVLARSSSNRIERRAAQARAEELPADISILASLKVLSENSDPSSIQPKPLPTTVPASSTNLTPDHYPTSSDGLSPGAVLRARIAHRAEERANAAAPSSPLQSQVTAGPKSSFASHFASRTDHTVDLPTRMRSQGDRLWIPAGQLVEVAGRELDGLLYVGRSLPRADGFGDENCLINPGLSVARSRADNDGRLMGYWPAYGAIQPTCRLAYLNWHADGRRDPETGIGYVFMFLYGLERRAILERSLEEHGTIRAELDRLLGIYGSHRAFLRYATALIGAIDAAGSDAAAEPGLVFEPDNGRLPLAVNLAIGRRVAEGRPIEADWMLAWTMSHPETRARTTARRAFDQLRPLFATRFDESHPEGLVIAPPKAKQRDPVYRAASGTFEVEIGGATEGLPDVWAIQEGIAAGRALLARCTDELDSYSRLIGRRPEAATTLSAISLLPPSLRSRTIGAVQKDRLDWFSSHVDSGQTVSFAEAYDRAFSAANENATPTKIRDLGDVLCRFGIGLIPDPRFPHRSPSSEELKLFDLGGPIETMEPASPGCRAAMLTTALAMLVAKSDGRVSSNERVLLLQIASKTEGVTLSERARLIADLGRLEEQPFDLASLKSKLAAMPQKQRRAIGEVCVAVACGDGVRHANEVQFLERIYRDLGLKASDLYASLAGELPVEDDSASKEPTPTDELVAISLGGPQARAYSIGSPSEFTEQNSAPAAEPAEVRPRVDTARLASIRAETEAIGAVLATVFDIELVPEVASLPTNHPGNVTHETDGIRFPGLDAKRSQLLQKLLERASWPRIEFDELARSFGLMPGGALEDLNDWAFGEFGDVVADDGETIDIHLEHFDSAALQDA